MNPGTISLALCVLSIVGSQANAQDGSTIPPNEPISGMSQEDWSRAWWQWAGSFENSQSPIADQTGEFCDHKQAGPVWFLAGTYGTHRTVRTCSVPRDKFLFFPLINYIVMPPVNRTVSCKAVTDLAASSTDGPSALILEIDGKRVMDLSGYRQATRECFDMGARAEPAIRIFPSAANGYYAMLRPLLPGKHVINFGGALPGLSQAVTYTLEVR